MATFSHILVPTDFGECAEHALGIAIEIAKPANAKITLVHVCETPFSTYAMYAQGLTFPMDEFYEVARQALATAGAALKARYSNSDSVFGYGPASDNIVDICAEQKCDLIVMGTHGRRGVSHLLLGSVAEKTVRLANVPVLTVPSPHSPKAQHVDETTRQNESAKSAVSH